jgi:hypothetical protein
MFDNLYRPWSAAPAGLRYPWDSRETDTTTSATLIVASIIDSQRGWNAGQHRR